MALAIYATGSQRSESFPLLSPYCYHQLLGQAFAMENVSSWNEDPTARVLGLGINFRAMTFGEDLPPVLDIEEIPPALKRVAGKVSNTLLDHNRLNAHGVSATLSVCFYERYRIYNNIIDLNAAIQEMQAATGSADTHSQRYGLSTFKLASLLTERYEARRDPSDLQEAMRLSEIARESLSGGGVVPPPLQGLRTLLSILAEKTPPFPPYRRHRFHGKLMPLEATLSLLILESIGLQYSARGDAESMRLARHYLPYVSTLISDSYPFEMGRYTMLLCFQLYLTSESGFQDVEPLRQLGAKCLQKSSGGLSSISPSVLHRIATVYEIRFKTQGQSEDDLEQVLLYARWAAMDDSNDDPEHPDRQELYANFSLIHFESFKDCLDLNNAIQYGMKSLRLSLRANFNLERYTARCNRVAQFFLRRFEELEMPNDLQEAFEYHVTARHLATQLESGNKVQKDIDKTTVFLMKFAEGRNSQKAIEFGAIILSEFILPMDIHSEVSNCFGSAHAMRYMNDPTEANLDSLEISMNCLLRDGRTFRRNVLAFLRAERSTLYGDIADLDAAIEALTDADETTITKHHYYLLSREYLLGQFFYKRYMHLGNEEDLRLSISHSESVLNGLKSSEHSEFRILVTMSIAKAHAQLSRRHSEDPIYIETALKIMNGCLASHDRETHSMSTLRYIQICLCATHMARHMNRGGEGELERISLLSSEIVVPHDDGQFMEHLFIMDFLRPFRSLGSFDKTHVVQQVSQEMHTSPSWLESIRKIGSADISPIEKLRYADIYGALALCYDFPECLEAYETCSSMLPRVLWIGGGVEDKYHVLHQMDIPGIAARATSSALMHGSTQSAIEYYEQGLSVAFRQLLQLRFPVHEELKQGHPGLASRYEEIVESILEHLEVTNLGNGKPLHHLARKYHQILADIQRQQGFERLFTRSPYNLLAMASKGGPVIILNRCTYLGHFPGYEDAIILLGPDKDPIRVQLSDHPSGHSYRLESLVSKLQEMLYDCHVIWSRRQFSSPAERLRAGKTIESEEEIDAKFEEFLEELREYIVDPVFDILSKNDITSGRIWWCPSGIFTRLPLHAAAPGCPYIQSYTYSLESLVQARNQLEESDHVSEVRMTAVGMEKYPDPRLSQLPSVPKELETIANLTQSHSMVLRELRNEDATVANVLSCLETSHIVHAACHGKRDPVNPLENGLCLHDDTLSLRRILLKDLRFARFMFLSACETASGKLELANESAHLTGGFIAAGFKGAIGTLWSIADSYAPDVAKGIYEAIISEDGLDITRAAEGLQNTISRLRESGVPYQYWMPYIHVGV